MAEEVNPRASSAVRRIELVWPGKDVPVIPRQQVDGRWVLEPDEGVWKLWPLIDLHGYPAEPKDLPSFVIWGDRLDVLSSLGRGLGSGVRLAYLDVPRIQLDDKTLAFQGLSDFTWSTWLSVIRAHLDAIQPLMRRDGVVVIHCGDLEEPFARLLASDVMRDNHIGTIVWQRHYAPRNMKGMKEFSATHDPILVYAVDKESIPPVGLRQVPSGYANPDDDPRGEWRAEHKGARTYRANSDFDAYVPPYRWRIVEGRLPSGLWRLSPLTGVIWGVPQEIGEFPLTVEVTDAGDSTAVAQIVLTIHPQGTLIPPKEVPWLLTKTPEKGPLRIVTKELPLGVVESEYSAICLAEGGKPWTDTRRPGSGRYWEFAKNTLINAYLRDAVYLGRDGLAIPHPKTYLQEVGEVEVRNQQTWWPGRDKNGAGSTAFAGYTEDATKHLKKLEELGLIERSVTTAKPERLLARLIEIFTDKEDLVMEVFGGAGDLSATAIKTGRRFVHLAGSTEHELMILDKCALPRYKAVVDGKDSGLESHEEGEIRLRADSYIPYLGGGSFVAARLGEWLLERPTGHDRPHLNRSAYSTAEALRQAVLTAEGYLPIADDLVHGRSFDGRSAAIVVSPNDYVTPLQAAQWASELAEKYERLVVYYFRASDDFDPKLGTSRVVFKRVPTELGT